MKHHLFFGLAIISALALPVEAATPASDILYGHFEMHTDYVLSAGSPDSGWRLNVSYNKNDDFNDRSQIIRLDPESTVFVAPPAAIKSITNAVSRLGPVGAPLWLLPQTNVIGTPYMGARAIMDPGIFQTYFQGNYSPNNMGSIGLRLVSMTGTGPAAGGNFALWESEAQGLNFYLDTSNGIDLNDRIPTLPPNAHSHFAWGFTKPGTYDLTVEAVGKLNPWQPDGNTITSTQKTFHFSIPFSSRLEGQAGVKLMHQGGENWHVLLEDSSNDVAYNPAQGFLEANAAATEVIASIPEAVRQMPLQFSTTGTSMPNIVGVNQQAAALGTPAGLLQSDQITFRLTSVVGPGSFAVVNSADTTIFVNSADGIDGSDVFNVTSTPQAVFAAFTKNGIYRVTGELTGILEANNQEVASQPFTLVFGAGVTADYGYATWSQSFENARGLASGILADATADYDNDGLKNGLEYLLFWQGHDPAIADADLLPQPRRAGSTTGLDFWRDTYKDTLNEGAYQLWTATSRDLSSWQFRNSRNPGWVLDIYETGIEEGNAYSRIMNRRLRAIDGSDVTRHFRFEARANGNAITSPIRTHTAVVIPHVLVLEDVVGNPIPDGGDCDIGQVGGKVAVTREFSLTNSGTVPVTGLQITKSGVDAPLLTVGGLSATSLAPGASTTFTVGFSSTALGLKAAHLEITFASPSGEGFNFDIAAEVVTGVAPVVATGAAGDINFDEATLNGTVNARGSPRSITFEYGLTTAYGFTVDAAPATESGNSVAGASSHLTGLLPHTKYHYRIRAEGALGAAVGTAKTFTTLSRPPQAGADAFNVCPDTKTTLLVLSNDTDLDGDAPILTAFTKPPAGAGTLVKSGNALIFTSSPSFTPANFPAGVSFDYTIKDAFGAPTSTATVSLTATSCVVTPAQSDVASAPLTYDLNITSSGAWAVRETVPWLTVAPTAGYGNGVVSVTLQANAAKADRRGLIWVGAQTHEVLQRGVIVPILQMPAVALPIATIVGADFALLIPTSNFPVTYAITNLPPGLKMDAATGVIFGKPTTAKAYDVTIKASNAAGKSTDVLHFTINVNPLPAGVVGVFQGYVGRHPVLNGNLGSRLELITTSRGTYTGKIITGVTSRAIAGAVTATAGDPNHPSLVVRVPYAGGVASLNLAFAGTQDALTGSLTDGAASAMVEGWRNSWTSANRASDYANLYTFSLAQP
ncbi:MAG TPA: choice-of-anchor M domain-containing protein, partial [Prosthecobacter sp.]|nr:choice-of-anchor M domain-containing protein [Prosthecobacter sp.]